MLFVSLFRTAACMSMNRCFLLRTRHIFPYLSFDHLSSFYLAESVGFEPTVLVTKDNTLAGCRFKPLIQLSIFHGVLNRNRTCIYPLGGGHSIRWTTRTALTTYSGAPDRIRTCNPCLRRAVLYPIELQAHDITKLAGQEGFEPPTPGFGDRRSTVELLTILYKSCKSIRLVGKNGTNPIIFLLTIWCAQRDSNPWPLVPKTSALSTEL